MATKKAATNTAEQSIILSVKDINADFAWNARSGDWRADSGTPDDDDKGEHTFESLVKSIQARGQDTAVTVRPSKKAGKYDLTAGFRRYAAICKIGELTKNPDIKIKAVVKSQNEAEARAENIRENTARDDLKGPDLAWSVHQLFVLQSSAGAAPSDSTLAGEIGKSQPYVSKLLRIMKGVNTKLTDQWRAAKVSITVNEMDSLAKLPKNEQEAEFKRMLESKGNSTGGQGAGGGKNAWFDSAKKKAEGLGELIGRLVKNELIDDTSLVFENHLDYMMKVNKKATARQRTSVAKAMQTGYDRALNAKDEPKGDDAGDDDGDEE